MKLRIAVIAAALAAIHTSAAAQAPTPAGPADRVFRIVFHASRRQGRRIRRADG